MKKNIFLSLVISVIALFATNYLLAFEVTASEILTTVTWEVAEFVYFKKSGPKFEMYNALNNKKVAVGVVHRPKKGLAILDLYHDKFKMEGVFWGHTMSGTMEAVGIPMKTFWRAIKVTGVWVCDNHYPKHTAISFQEMKNLTNNEGCANWSLVK